MKYILDTHTFIWLDSAPEKLSSLTKTVMKSFDNTLLLSIASIWEIQLKVQLGKLVLPLPLQEIIESQQQTNNIQLLHILPSHIFSLQQIPLYHRDPFDRMLIAQANEEDATVITMDKMFSRYDVNILW